MDLRSLKRILLVLDLDETLVHARPASIPGRRPDFVSGGHSVYKRPFLDEFLQSCSQHFELAVWSAGGKDYVEPTVERIFKDLPPPVFVWSSQRCTRRFDPETDEQYFIKDFNKLRKRGVDLRRALIVDNLRLNCRRNYGNAIYVQDFEGQADDVELLKLAAYLLTLKDLDDVRTVEKRGWRD